MKWIKKNVTRCLIVLGLIGTMGACASTHIAAPDTSPVESSIQAAQEAGAQQYAPDRINSAKQELKQAKALVKQKKYKKASRLTREATVDANLAMAATRSKKNQESIGQLQESVNELKGPIQELQREMTNVQAKMTSHGAVLTFSKMLFSFDKTDLQPGALKTVSTLARFLQNHPKLNVLIAGYTDNVGAEKYNQKLSQQRANSVKNALVSDGVSSDRIQTVGYGEQYPIASNSTAVGRQLNRRVEVTISQNNNPAEPQQQNSNIIMQQSDSTGGY